MIHLYQGTPHYPDVIRWMERCAYQLRGLHGVQRRPNTAIGPIAEMNALFGRPQ
jgi:hypothetical protein